MRNRLSEPRRTIIAVTGPRQVGKTTLVRQALEGAQVPLVFESADALVRPSDGWISSIWNRTRIQANKGTAVLVLDEIQKVQDWSEIVKKEWDADTRNNTDIRVILLGSSTVFLNRGLTESLAGRFEQIHTMPWSFAEMASAFGWDLQTYSLYGGYPGSAPYINDVPRWTQFMLDSIIEPVILKDILQMQRIDKPELMRQLMFSGAQLSAREVSFTKLLGLFTNAGNTSTLVHYLDLLEGTGILCGISKYSRSVMHKRSSPKLLVFANGIATACGAEWNSQMIPSQRGRCYESMVGAHLRNIVEGTQYTLSWWREGTNEVDYVVHAYNKCTAIEVSTSSNHNWRGLGAFAEKFPGSKTLVVGEGGVPFEVFMRMGVEQIVPRS